MQSLNEGTLKTAKTIAIWGYGREGVATYEHLKKIGVSAVISIVSDEAPDTAPDDCKILTGQSGTKAIAGGEFDLVIKSPGISLYRGEIAEGKKAGTIFTSATNIWLQAHPSARTIAVTGTKGKSTTAKLICHILNELGTKSELAGNVGRPLMDISKPSEITVIELSSYQIADLEIAPEFAVILNLYPEHIPWHGDKETYFSDKLRILSLSPAAKALLNASDDEIKKRTGAVKNPNWFNEPSSYRAIDTAVYKGENKIITLDHTNLLGTHNLSKIGRAHV